MTKLYLDQIIPVAVTAGIVVVVIREGVMGRSNGEEWMAGATS